MPIRNPFAKRQGVGNGLDSAVDESSRTAVQNGGAPGFERADTTGSMSSTALSINSAKSQEPPEYKLSGKTPGSVADSENAAFELDCAGHVQGF